jgi:hypothetical protein
VLNPLGFFQSATFRGALKAKGNLKRLSHPLSTFY